MLIKKHTIETTATPAQIWQLWMDVENWKDWDHFIEFSNLNGVFAAGTKGKLKMLNSPVLSMQITKCQPFRMYVLEVALFFAKSVSTCLIECIDNKNYVTFINEIRGPLSFFYKFNIGKEINKKTENEMKQMLSKAISLSN